jgi:hypothetical protein
MKQTFLTPVCALALLAVGPGSASLQATTLNYPDFSSVAGLQINGNAAQVGNVLRVTPSLPSQSGSVFSTTTIALAGDISFSTYFTFRISQPGGISDVDDQGADGLVFALQTVSNTAGGVGGGIGYSGLSPSVGVEFDTWNNGGWDDNDGNHVGINLGGNIDSVAQIAYSTRMNDGDIWHAWVDYDGLSDALEVRLGANDTRPVSPLLSYTVDLAAQIAPNVYAGFTSGTGAAYGDHDVLSWVFRDTYKPVDPNEPPSGGGVPDGGSTLALLGLALAGLSCARRR